MAKRPALHQLAPSARVPRVEGPSPPPSPPPVPRSLMGVSPGGNFTGLANLNDADLEQLPALPTQQPLAPFASVPDAVAYRLGRLARGRPPTPTPPSPLLPPPPPIPPPTTPASPPSPPRPTRQASTTMMMDLSSDDEGTPPGTPVGRGVLNEYNFV